MSKPFKKEILVVVQVHEGEVVDVLGEFHIHEEVYLFITKMTKIYPSMEIETRSIWRTYDFV